MCQACKKTKAEFDKIKSAVKLLGHIPNHVSGGSLCDGYVCSCGWQSRQYWDFEEAALDEWIEHAKTILATG